MNVLKFRVMYEEDDSVFRDVEILPTQSLLNFETVIIQSFNLPVSDQNQFFSSDDQWHLLRPLPQRDERSRNAPRAKILPALISYIDDPHQKFIFRYSGTSEFTFLAELLSITGQEKKEVEYPVVTRKQGASPYKKDDLITRAVPVPAGKAGESPEDDNEEDEDEPEGIEEWIDEESTESLGSVSAEQLEGESKAEAEEEPDEKNFEEDFDETADDNFNEEFGGESDALEE